MKELSINLINFGEKQCCPGYEYGGIREYYVLHFIIEGTGEYKVNGISWRLSKGDAFLIRPRERHLYVADTSDPWKYVWVCFTGNLESLFSKVNISQSNLSAHIGDLNEIIKHINKLKKSSIYLKPEIFMSNFSHLAMVISLFIENFHYTSAMSMSNKNMGNNHVMAMQCYIEQNYMSTITVKDVIDYIRLDRAYASNLYKNVLGLTIYQDIQNRRVLRAKELLSKNFTIKEVSYICGFSSYQNFLNVFKSISGMTPKKFRGQLNDPLN